MRMLESLARIQSTGLETLLSMIHHHRFNLSWGTTLILIAGQVEGSLFDELFAAKRTGLDIVLVLCGEVTGFAEIKRRAEYYKIPVYHFFDERDLEIWRN